MKALPIALALLFLTALADVAADQLLLLHVSREIATGGCTDNLLLETGDALLLETGGATDCLTLE